MSHVWDSDQLWLKACSFMEHARNSLSDEQTEPLWASLALELLARAALTSVHRVLNADPQDEGTHILFALGYDSKKQPKSIPAHAVFSRLERIFPDFKEHRPVCDYLAALRNEDLHSGGIPFQSLQEQAWLAPFYAACACLCTILKCELRDLLGTATPHALELVDLAKSEARGEVLKRIAAHASTFSALSPDERSQAIEVGNFIVRPSPRREKCPACGGSAVLEGEVSKEARPVFVGDQLLVDRTYAVKTLRCRVCDLWLRSAAECAIAKVRPRFVLTEITDLHEIHEDDVGEEYDNM